MYPNRDAMRRTSLDVSMKLKPASPIRQRISVRSSHNHLRTFTESLSQHEKSQRQSSIDLEKRDSKRVDRVIKTYFQDKIPKQKSSDKLYKKLSVTLRSSHASNTEFPKKQENSFINQTLNLAHRPNPDQTFDDGRKSVDSEIDSVMDSERRRDFMINRRKATADPESELGTKPRRPRSTIENFAHPPRSVDRMTPSGRRMQTYNNLATENAPDLSHFGTATGVPLNTTNDGLLSSEPTRGFIIKKNRGRSSSPDPKL